MRSEERHKLKTNELADSLVGLRDWVKNNASQVVGGIMIIAAVIIAVQWWFNSRAQGVQRHAVNLQQQLLSVERLQSNAASQAQDPDDKENTILLTTGYNIDAETAAMGQLAKKGNKNGLGATALLAQADAFRSELMFSTEPLDDAAREDILTQASKLYEKAFTEAPNSAYAVGYGHLGLGLVAEDRGDMDAARKQYETILSHKDGLLAGTVWPGHARQRLKVLEDIAGELITFPEAPEPEPTEPAIEQTSPEEQAAQAPAEPASDAAEPTDAPAEPAADAPMEPAPDATQPAPADAQG